MAESSDVDTSDNASAHSDDNSSLGEEPTFPALGEVASLRQIITEKNLIPIHDQATSWSKIKATHANAVHIAVGNIIDIAKSTSETDPVAIVNAAQASLKARNVGGVDRAIRDAAGEAYVKALAVQKTLPNIKNFGIFATEGYNTSASAIWHVAAPICVKDKKKNVDRYKDLVFTYQQIARNASGQTDDPDSDNWNKPVHVITTLLGSGRYQWPLFSAATAAFEGIRGWMDSHRLKQRSRLQITLVVPMHSYLTDIYRAVAAIFPHEDDVLAFKDVDDTERQDFSNDIVAVPKAITAATERAVKAVLGGGTTAPVNDNASAANPPQPSKRRRQPKKKHVIPDGAFYIGPTASFPSYVLRPFAKAYFVVYRDHERLEKEASVYWSVGHYVLVQTWMWLAYKMEYLDLAEPAKKFRAIAKMLYVLGGATAGSCGPTAMHSLHLAALRENVLALEGVMHEDYWSQSIFEAGLRYRFAQPVMTRSRTAVSEESGEYNYTLETPTDHNDRLNRARRQLEASSDRPLDFNSPWGDAFAIVYTRALTVFRASGAWRLPSTPVLPSDDNAIEIDPIVARVPSRSRSVSYSFFDDDNPSTEEKETVPLPSNQPLIDKNDHAGDTATASTPTSALGDAIDAHGTNGRLERTLPASPSPDAVERTLRSSHAPPPNPSKQQTNALEMESNAITPCSGSARHASKESGHKVDVQMGILSLAHPDVEKPSTEKPEPEKRKLRSSGKRAADNATSSTLSKRKKT